MQIMMQLFIKFIQCFYVVAHHIAHVLRFEDFELTTEREKERDEFVVRDNVDGYAIAIEKFGSS